jgi:hypothetical protein
VGAQGGRILQTRSSSEGRDGEERERSPQERGRRQVGLDDAAIEVECEVGDRGLLVQLRVARPRCLELFAGFAQLSILYLELDPMKL